VFNPKNARFAVAHLTMRVPLMAPPMAIVMAGSGLGNAISEVS
jgi:hypothetical protein